MPPPFSLTGQWTRINSSFGELDGMVVQVNGPESQAVITATPANIYIFQSGDLKWRNIVKVSDDEYEYEALVRQAIAGTQSHIPGLITVNDGVSISLSFPTTGTFQDWIVVE
ncbi:MAG TPA: hypothetical protein VMM79_13270 [Longimicrobiales bacterium]|nr:hypothetical protein [Longimicrobiales bacterium]